MQQITPCLWFDTQAEEAAEFYTSLFPNSRVVEVSRYPEGMDRAGQALVVQFELNGTTFTALNGGPQFPFTEAVSFQIDVHGQEEADRYWDALVADGGEESKCGWLKDKYGLSWQVVPDVVPTLLGGSDPEAAARVGQALMGMTRIDIAALERAAAGEAVPAG